MVLAIERHRNLPDAVMSWSWGCSISDKLCFAKGGSMGECMWAMSLLHNKIAKKIRLVAGSSDMGGFMVADSLANFTKTIKKHVVFCFFHHL